MLKDLTLYFILSTSLFITACGGGDNANNGNNGNNDSIDGTKSISVKWDIPTTRVDGVAIAMSEINGYKIYLAKNVNFISDTPVATINDGSATSFTINNLPSGTYYIYMTTYDSFGDESPYSNPISKSI